MALCMKSKAALENNGYLSYANKLTNAIRRVDVYKRQVLILVLLVKPTGLLGKPVREKV